MKKIFILQNSNIPYDMRISKLYNPNQHKLYFIVDDLNYSIMKQKNDEKYFENIFQINEFNIDNILHAIKPILSKIENAIEFITEAEECVILCGELRKYFGISKNNYERFINKLIMKEQLHNKEIRIPKHRLFEKLLYLNNKNLYIEKILNYLSFPLLVKPIDQASCIGVEKIATANQFKNWCESALSSSFDYEIDEFIEGTLFHCDSLIQNKKVLYTQVSRCSRPCFDFIEGKAKGSIVLKPSSEDFINLSKWTESVLRSIDPPDNGVTHLEVFKTKTGEYVFLEIAHRAAGILIPDMYKKHLNIDIITLHLLLQIDNNFKISINNGPYAAWMAFPTQQGILDQITPPKIKSQHEMKWFFKKGDFLKLPKKGRDYVATIFLWNDDYQELENDFHYLNDFIPYTVR